MRVGVVTEPGSFVIEDRAPVSKVPEGWVLIDICAVGICGTDYHILEGKHPFLAYPRAIGHELSGRVVQDGLGWTKGELVVVNPYLSCGTCRACRHEKPNCCTNIAVLGVHKDGGLAEQVAVPSGNLYSAKGLTKIQAAMVEFLAIGAHAVRRSGVGSGDNALVTGVGPIGIGTALFARLKGANVSLLDVSPARLQKANSLFGFEDGFGTISDAVASQNGDGFDVVFDATGHGGAIEAGFSAVAHGGTYVLVSVVKDNISFSDPEFHKREMSLLGSRNALKEDFDWVISAFEEDLIDADALCSSLISLDELNAQFNALAVDRSGLIKVIVDMED